MSPMFVNRALPLRERVFDHLKDALSSLRKSTSRKCWHKYFHNIDFDDDKPYVSLVKDVGVFKIG